MADTQKIDVPLIYDEYLGYAYGNILDQFATPTYNLKLYMLRETASKNATSEPASADDSLTAAPGDTVVLAQTGVTGTQIDNLEISHLVNSSGFVGQSVDFTIDQPGAADFLDQIQLARIHLGQHNSAVPTLFLEVNFIGYSSDVDDEDAGGEIVQNIAGPFRYKLRLLDLDVNISEQGSRYNVKCITEAGSAFSDANYRTPVEITTSGSTITEHVKEFEAAINKHYTEDGQPEGPDEFVFDLSELIAPKEPPSLLRNPDADDQAPPTSDNLILDESVFTSATQDTDTFNRMSEITSGGSTPESRANNVLAAGNAIERSDSFRELPKLQGNSAEQIINKDKVTIARGETYLRYLAILLSMNAEFYSKITRKAGDINDITVPLRPEQAYITWFRFKSKVEQLEFVPGRNQYRRRYTYTPILYKTIRNDVAVDPAEVNMTSDDAVKRLQQIYNKKGLMKSYNYLFTGQNDQVLNLDISYDNGIGLLLPPKGGAFGDPSIVLSDSLAARLPQNVDPSPKGLKDQFLNKAKTAGEKERVTSFFKYLDDNRDRIPEFGDTLEELSRRLEVESPQRLNNIIRDANQNQGNLQNFIDQFSNERVSDIAQGTTINSTITESPETTQNADLSNYTPQLSGYAYSADILNPAENSELSAAELQDLGYITLDDQSNLKLVRMVVGTRDMPNPVEGATTRNRKVENKLFGFLVNQHAATTFLQTVDISLRGDPWYIGGPQGRVADQYSSNIFRDDQCFWLSIRAPIKYDPDWLDEDNNTGYWRYDGKSRTFSGCYRIQSVTNRFSGGIFTCDVQAIREIGADVLGDKNIQGNDLADDTPAAKANPTPTPTTQNTGVPAQQVTENPEIVNSTDISDPGGA